MNKSTLALVAAGVLTAAVSQAQPPYTLTQLWKVDTSSTLTWFQNDNNTRGMTYNPGTQHVLVVGRTGALNVYQLDPATGAQLGTLDVTGVSGGTFAGNLIHVAADGKLYLTNLAAATSTFKIYTYASESAAPVNSYTEAGVPVRYGDSADVRSSGSNVDILVSGSGNTNVAVFSSTDGGATFAKQAITLDVALVGIPYVKWDPTVTNAFFVRKAAASGTEQPPLRRYTISGTNGTLDTSFGDQITSVPGVAAFDVKVTANGHVLVASTYGAMTSGATNLLGLIHEVPSSTLVAQTASGLEKAGGANANGNGSGAAAMDLASSRVWFLYTNNSISGWSMPPQVSSAVSDWNLY